MYVVVNMIEPLGASPFSPSWYLHLVEAWNLPSNLEDQIALAGAGPVVFIVCEVGGLELRSILEWNPEGKARVVSMEDQSMPSFRASRSIWLEFVSGRLSAVTAVLYRKIRFQGPMTFAIKYGPEFDRLARIARAIENI